MLQHTGNTDRRTPVNTEEAEAHYWLCRCWRSEKFPEWARSVCDNLAEIAKISPTNRAQFNEDVTAALNECNDIGSLVFRLELSARLAGGKFSAHRKNGVKGSLLKAIGLLRSKILISGAPDAARWAARLPSEGEHPISDYERILTAARKKASLVAQ
jgi:hypothetical protein